MDDHSPSPRLSRTTTFLEGARRTSDGSQTLERAETNRSDGDGSTHIRMEEPAMRPAMLTRKSLRGASTKSISEALRAARSREEQDTLLGDGVEADDDGCYPPRKNDDPRIPNPHRALPVYNTTHKIRRLIIASIGRETVSSSVAHVAN